MNKPEPNKTIIGKSGRTSTHVRLFREVKSKLEKRILTSNASVLVGVSGGVDSSVLFHIVAEICDHFKKDPPIGAHIHHGLRGEEADRDAESARKLVRMHSDRFECVYLNPTEQNLSEEAMRNARFAALGKLAQKYEPSFVLLAHNLEDQAETVLLRLISGTGPKGLGGIRTFRAPIWVRPLLGVSRSVIEREAQECKIPFVLDSSNLSNDYTRNFLRNEILPRIHEHVNPKAAKHLSEMAELFQGIDAYLRSESEKWLERSLVGENRYIIEKLKDIPEALVHPALVCMFERLDQGGPSLVKSQLKSMARYLRNPRPGFSLDLPAACRMRGDGKLLILEKI